MLLFVESMYHSAIISVVAWSLRDSNLSVLFLLLGYYAPAPVSRGRRSIIVRLYRSFDSRTSDLSRLHPRNRPNRLLALSEGTYAYSTHVTAASESCTVCRLVDLHSNTEEDNFAQLCTEVKSQISEFAVTQERKGNLSWLMVSHLVHRW
ncbi:hypothetical protein B0H17DRAFT_639363 [Mycena rosella]|uniref:Uncharacterized protein n=1 Tax=Mycena rosella TaxID=1033263 RepID=A0AAD7BF50_MYCRO|nr:hypothetical protein B0H17DRAFT_639363 [Mycena rosella]